MWYYVKLYILILPVFFAMDMLWLGWLGRTFYREKLAAFLSPEVNWSAAVLFYLLYIIGILIFAVLPALDKNLLSRAIIWGALFGFFTYATYDLTNLATLKNWPLSVVVVDVLWGTILCAVVAATGFGIGKWLQTG